MTKKQLDLDLVEPVEEEAPQGETREEAFMRVAQARFDKCVYRIRQMHNLKNSNYEYSVEQAEALCDAIVKEAETLRNVLKRDVGDIPKLF